MKKTTDGIIKSSAILAICLLSQACSESSQSVKIDTPQPTSTTNNETNTFEATSNSDDYKYIFSGNTEERIDYTNTRGNYVLQMTLLSEAGQIDARTTDTTPAMPLISDSLAIYTQDGTYKFGIRPFTGDPIDVFAGISEDETNIRLVNTVAGAKLFVNDVEQWSGSRLKALSFVKLGRGFKDRYWAGKVKSFEVCVIKSEVDLTTANCS